MESIKVQSDFLAPDTGDLVENSEKGKCPEGKSEGFIGVLDVYIHQAMDIHNICIYQNQDVYARLSLTSDPEQVVSTQIINGGGRNPVFDENVRLNVRNIDSSVRCEVWMLSRVRNYLEDQLLGFTSVPLCEVLIENGKPEQEFSLSSSDLYHSPAGFVQLTLTYTGASPDVLEIPASHSCTVVDVANKDSEVDDSVPCELDKIEFPDPEIVNENERMASEYFAIPCPDLECKSTEQCASASSDGQLTIRNNGCVQEAVALDGQGANDVPVGETPPTILKTAEPPSVLVPINPSSVSHELSIPEPPNQDEVSKLKDKGPSPVNNVATEVPDSTITQSVVNVTIEPEQKVVQQEIVEIYMKSMQQFTEALAKMKLPMDIGDSSGADNVDSSTSGTSGSSEKANASKSSEPSPKVFYGSRAFF
nr:uncharacterized protein LOC113691104 [Coffea arabica]XP_027065108.1 uncharacterized protein LOC113691104 [Coffea arabica]XP_027065109.1 uncharacterized protein LOC113691104 [Coffea arabica]